MKVTIKDIAKASGLSISAVSFVLNDKPCRINEKNKQKIRDIAKQMNYSPNQAARSLVTKESKMLALILPDIENMFFSSLAKSIEDCCRQEGYVLLISSTGDCCEADAVLLQSILSRNVDGVFLIVSNASFKAHGTLLKDLKQISTPFVMIDRVYDGFSCDKVYFDNELGARMAVSHLLECGHRKIGCVSSSVSASGKARLQGYKKALEAFGISPEAAYIIEGDYHFESGYDGALELSKTDVTAAFVANDMMTMGFLKAFYEKGIRIPADFSLVSYDNALPPFILGTELTTVAQDAAKLGREAYMLLKERMNHQSDMPRSICLKPDLVMRSSVKKV